MHRSIINLTSTGSYTPWISTFGKFLLAATVQARSGATWASAVVGLEWSMTNDDYQKAVTFDPVVNFTNSSASNNNINIASLPWVRFRVTTAESSGDPSATVIYMTE